jgi:hypothetical protein
MLRFERTPAAQTMGAFLELSPYGRWLVVVPFDIERGVPEIWLFDAVSGTVRRAVSDPASSTYLSGRPTPAG